MIECLGNTGNLIDWDSFISQLETIDPMVGYQYDEDRAESIDPAILDTQEAWTKAGYNIKDTSKNSPIAWEAWYSGLHFDNTIQDLICDMLNLTPVDHTMVTRLVPGRFAPWHWDIKNEETVARLESYNKPIVRLHIHMNKPQPGHVFVVGDHCFYNEQQGSIYKWPSWRSYHAGANCGLVSKYQFSIIAVER